MTRRRRAGAWGPRLLMLAACWASVALADEPLPAKLQVVLFKKIFQYDRTLAPAGKLRVGVQEGPGSDDVIKGFSDAGFTAVLVKEGTVDESVHVVHFNKASAPLKDFCTKARVLSISSTAILAEAGHVSVALRRRDDGRPEILIHRARAKAEGQDFSADLLGLATVIQ